MNTEEKRWALENMRYDPDTGVLERRITHCGRNSLKQPYWKVCSVKPGINGYLRVGVLGSTQSYHRICWLLANGDIDDALFIDHINGKRDDNRLCNLRLVTSRENQQNRQCHRDGNLAGASWVKHAGKWLARIMADGVSRHIGYFDTELEAHEAHEAYHKLYEQQNR